MMMTVLLQVKLLLRSVTTTFEAWPPLLTERFPSFAFHSSVWNLGVVLDSTLTFSEHVANAVVFEEIMW